MSINIHNLSFGYPSRDTLFSGVSMSVAAGEKASLVGDNGTGKSTLLRIIAGTLRPLAGEAARTGTMWFVPQHFGQYDHLSIAGALGIEEKLNALTAILAGDASEENYTALGDDWNIAENAAAALGEWGMDGFGLERPFGTLSGGEKTKVFLAGIKLHSPTLVLMDEPTNHLDGAARGKLYGLVAASRAAVLIVSHDRALLDLVDTTWELSARGAERYGGNYGHYKALRDAKLGALEGQIAETEKALDVARRTARKALERQSRRESHGAAKSAKEGIPRIMLKTLGDSAAATTSRLRGSHEAKTGALEDELRRSREELPRSAAIKIRLAGSGLHTGKTLVEGSNINFSYGGEPLWETPFSFRIDSGDRVAIRGGNGSGKSTLVRLILGELEPTEGEIRRSGARTLCIDQQYSLVDDRLTVLEQAAAFNSRSLPEHIVRTELHRFLFPADTWDKPCAALSGGEKMKLIFCSLIIGDSAPDMLILDEPANNLDIRSLELVASALKDYKGTLAVISHDERFMEELGIDKEIVPGKTSL